MTLIGFHASHEEHSPQELLGLVKQAEAAGFTAAMCSDHFHPWSERQGESGFAWSWLGAALEGTRISFGTVCAPGQQLPPGHRGPGSGNLGANVSRSVLAGRWQWRSAQ